ncbi:hypothetical protein MJD09_09045 [bacterium]|nr:hypothetical protein [bacterium]
MKFKMVYIVEYPHLNNLRSSVELLMRVYAQILVRFSISFFENGQAALLAELRLDRKDNRNKMAIAIQNSMEMHGLRIENIYRLFNQDPASVQKIRRKYFGNRKVSFDIQSIQDLEKVFDADES